MAVTVLPSKYPMTRPLLPMPAGGDADPIGDKCSNPAGDQVTMAGRNIGDLLNDKGITWGSFMGGFDLTVKNANGTTDCQRQTDPTAPGAVAGSGSTDYIPHHAWFQYSSRKPAGRL